MRLSILSRLPSLQSASVRIALLALSVSGAALATLVGSEPDSIATQTVSQSLTLAASAPVRIDDEGRGVFLEERVQRGDTLAALLARLGVNDSAAFNYLRSQPDARALSSNLRPGRAIRAETGSDGNLIRLDYALSATESVIVERTDNSFRTQRMEIEAERRVHMKSAEIRYSLFGAADAAGLPDAVTTQIAEIFSGDIDFHKDIRKGDRFRVVYEMFYSNGEWLRSGKVLAAEFINNGKMFAAVWYDNPADREASGYYTPEGKNLRKAFLRSPLEFSRVTSGFGGRMHPIHNTWRQHTGVDYGAPTGTRIRATGDGVVDFVGRQGGYGNMVVIRHQGRFSTLYAHMSGFGPNIKKGARVSQGETVGFVGQTGWATGPHLHYEFRVADAAVNPLTVTLPTAQPLHPGHLADFRGKAQVIESQLASLRSRPVVAVANFE